MINSISSAARYIANELCGKRPESKIVILDGDRSPGSRRDARRVNEEMRSGAFNSAIALEKLEAAKLNPVKITETWILLGIFDPGIKSLKTDLRELLKPYVSDFSKIKLETNALAAFQNLSIDDLALKFINNLIDTHKSSIEETIKINIVAHSMGGAIATRAVALLSQLELSKKYIINRMVFLNSPIQGARVASVGGSIACCCSKNIMRDLMVQNSKNRMHRINGVRATYFSSRLDNIVETSKAAYAGGPVVQLETRRATAHTDIISHPVPLSYIIK